MKIPVETASARKPKAVKEPERKSTAAPNVHILDTAFYIPQLDRNRRIWIYLPPAYEKTQLHYQVMYMHDGQNLFDDLTSYVGEWGVDEVLNKMSEEGFPGIIVVGIDHGIDERRNEYSPWVNEKMGGGQGEKYTTFIVETLKPYIDARYRTLSGPEHTGIGGSSMGGLISMYATHMYPETFGRSLIFSPAFWFAEGCYELALETKVRPGTRMYFLAGGKEYGEIDVLESTQRMIDILLKNGLSEENYRYVADPEGEHNEKFWNQYFGEAIDFLFR